MVVRPVGDVERGVREALHSPSACLTRLMPAPMCRRRTAAHHRSASGWPRGDRPRVPRRPRRPDAARPGPGAVRGAPGPHRSSPAGRRVHRRPGTPTGPDWGARRGRVRRGTARPPPCSTPASRRSLRSRRSGRDRGGRRPARPPGRGPRRGLSARARRRRWRRGASAPHRRGERARDRVEHLDGTANVRPCSRKVYQVALIPASIASSSRRRPGVRRRDDPGSPTSTGLTRSRRARRNAPSSRRCCSVASLTPCLPGGPGTSMRRLWMASRCLRKLGACRHGHSTDSAHRSASRRSRTRASAAAAWCCACSRCRFPPTRGYSSKGAAAASRPDRARHRRYRDRRGGR